MKATDLRIGNWVLLGSKEFTVNIIEQFKGTNAINELNQDMINPIPLTAAWLEDFGFEYLDSVTELWGFKGHCFSWRTGDFSRKDGSAITDGKLYYFIDKQPELNRKPLEFVHEIQNLIFALTGTELSNQSL